MLWMDKDRRMLPDMSAKVSFLPRKWFEKNGVKP